MSETVNGFPFDAAYELEIAGESKRRKLPMWVLRRLSLIFGDSPYQEIPISDLPVRYFGEV